MNIEMNYSYYELNFESMKQEDDDVNIVLSYFFSRLILIQRYKTNLLYFIRVKIQAEKLIISTSNLHQIDR